MCWFKAVFLPIILGICRCSWKRYKRRKGHFDPSHPGKFSLSLIIFLKLFFIVSLQKPTREIIWLIFRWIFLGQIDHFLTDFPFKKLFKGSDKDKFTRVCLVVYDSVFWFLEISSAEACYSVITSFAGACYSSLLLCILALGTCVNLYW